MKRQRYAPHGALALMPEAFGMIFDLPETKDEAEVNDVGVAVVTIRGPLMHRKEFFFDSYEEIKERVAQAIELKPKLVLLSIDSPGGVVSGMLDTARELRKMAESAGVKLHAHVDGHATSAAYGLASAASWIGVSETAMLGSIGVIDTMVDATGANQMMGLQVELIASGDRKTDGNPNVAISDGARASRQTRVDDLAQMFFTLVDEHDWGKGAAALEAMQASIVHGADAVRIGLASEIATIDQSIAFADPEALRTGPEATARKGTNSMATPMEDAVASLRKAAEGDDEEEAKKAKAALKSLGAEEDPDAEDDGDDTDAEDDDGDDDKEDAKAKAKAKADAKAAAAEDDDDEPGAEDDDGEPDAKGASALLSLAAEVHELKAERASEKREAKREELLASRPDFEPALVEILKTAPMAVVRKTVKTLKRGPSRKRSAAAAATATSTVRGEGQGDGMSARLPPEEKAALDARMGLTAMITKTVHTPTRMSFGVPVATPANPITPITTEGK